MSLENKLNTFVVNFLKEGGDAESWDAAVFKKLVKSSTPSLKKLKDPNAPKKPKSAYIFFVVSNREGVVKSNPKISTTDVMKEIGALWKKVSKKQKTKFEKMAVADKARYAGEM
jgi:hypothetical protein